MQRVAGGRKATPCITACAQASALIVTNQQATGTRHERQTGVSDARAAAVFEKQPERGTGNKRATASRHQPLRFPLSVHPCCVSAPFEASVWRQRPRASRSIRQTEGGLLPCAHTWTHTHEGHTKCSLRISLIALSCLSPAFLPSPLPCSALLCSLLLLPSFAEGRDGPGSRAASPSSPRVHAATHTRTYCRPSVHTYNSSSLARAHRRP